MAKHPSPLQLQKFGRGLLSRWQARKVVRHLLNGCVSCNEITSQLLPDLSAEGAGGRAATSFDYDSVFAATRNAVEAGSSALAREAAEVPELLSALAAAAFPEGLRLVTREVRFQTWTLCVRLLDSAREIGFQDPPRALELARLSVELAGRLDPKTYGEKRVLDLEGRAWTVLANAERIQSDFREAERSFGRAEQLLDRGTGDPLERAFFLLAKASLRGNQQRFREAFRLIDRVLAIGRWSGDRHLCGKALITRGFLLGLANDQEAAVRLLAAGIEMAGPAADPRLLVAAHHNLALYLTESGRFEEAMLRLERTRPLYLQLGDRMNLLRLQWLEGKIATALGDLARAEGLLQEVRRELAEHRLGLDFALLCLDLARIYARQRRGTEMRRLAEEMLPIFQSRDVHREAIAALLVFQQAAEMERVTLGLVQELSEHLKECRAASGLRSRGSL